MAARLTHGRKFELLAMDMATFEYSESISYSKAVLRRKEIQADASDNQRAGGVKTGTDATEGENERASERAGAGGRGGSCISDLGIAMGRAADVRTDADGVSECVGK